MAFPVARKGKAVTVFDANGRLMRTHECRNVQCAVALEEKLVGDPAFAIQWACGGDHKIPETKRHGLERPMAGA